MNLRRGRPGKLPAPVDDMDARIDPMGRAMLADAMSCACVGSIETIRHQLAAIVERTDADEIMATAQIFDHEARKRSFAILAELGREIGAVRTIAAADGGSGCRPGRVVRARW